MEKNWKDEERKTSGGRNQEDRREMVGKGKCVQSLGRQKGGDLVTIN